MTGGPLLRAVGVTKRFGPKVAVRPLDLEIERGEYFCILGPSGSGKSTLLRMFGGFEAPDAGEIYLADARVDHLPPEKRDANTVFQGYALFPHLSVFENVAFGLQMRGVRGGALRRQVQESLTLVGLPHFGARAPGSLSGGEQQRVALARALVNRPSILLLDEPLAALDRRLRLRMQSELTRIQRETGIAFVHVTHDQEEALRLGDRLAVMHDGRFLRVGPPADVYERPGSAFVADFLGSANLFRARSSGDRIIVAGGPLLEVPQDSRLPPEGAEGAYAIRPETLRAVAVGSDEAAEIAPGVNRLEGTVTELRRIGGVEEVAVRIGELALTLHRRGPADSSVLEAGDPVVVLVEARHVVPLSEGDPADDRPGEGPSTGMSP